MSKAHPRIAEVLAAVQELAARFEAEAAERRRLWGVALETPRRIAYLESDHVSLAVRVARLEAQVRTLKRPP